MSHILGCINSGWQCYSACVLDFAHPKWSSRGSCGKKWIDDKDDDDNGDEVDDDDDDDADDGRISRP